MADRRMREGELERYGHSGEKNCLRSEPDLNRVRYVSKVCWQVKNLNNDIMNAVQSTDWHNAVKKENANPNK